MASHVEIVERKAGIGRIAAKVTRIAVDTLKPTVRAVVSMVGRHPEAAVGATAGYVVGKQLDRVWGLRYLTGGQAKYVLAFIGGAYGYRMALLRRNLDIRESKSD